jgi:hypothetical protein
MGYLYALNSANNYSSISAEYIDVNCEGMDCIPERPSPCGPGYHVTQSGTDFLCAPDDMGTSPCELGNQH